MAVKQKIQSGTLNAKEAVSTHYSDYNRMVCNYIAADDTHSDGDLINWTTAKSRHLPGKGVILMPDTGTPKSTGVLLAAATPFMYTVYHAFTSLNHAARLRAVSTDTNQLHRTKIHVGDAVWINQPADPQTTYLEVAHHLGNAAPIINVQPSPLDQLIEKAKRLKELPFDWDEDGALPIEETTIEYSSWFLKHYYNYIARHFAVTIQLPEIDPCPDGSIDLAWHTPNAQLLINIRKDKEGTFTAFYYGDRHNNKMQVKGSTPLSEFSEHLAVWMKYLA